MTPTNWISGFICERDKTHCTSTNGIKELSWKSASNRKGNGTQRRPIAHLRHNQPYSFQSQEPPCSGTLILEMRRTSWLQAGPGNSYCFSFLWARSRAKEKKESRVRGRAGWVIFHWLLKQLSTRVSSRLLSLAPHWPLSYREVAPSPEDKLLLETGWGVCQLWLQEGTKAGRGSEGRCPCDNPSGFYKILCRQTSQGSWMALWRNKASLSHRSVYSVENKAQDFPGSRGKRTQKSSLTRNS